MSCRGSMVLAQGLSLHEPPAKPASKEPLRSLCLFWGEKSCPPLKKHEMHQNAWNQWRKHIETWGDDIKWRKYDQMIKSLSMCKKGWTMCIFDMSLADVGFWGPRTSSARLIRTSSGRFDLARSWKRTENFPHRGRDLRQETRMEKDGKGRYQLMSTFNMSQLEVLKAWNILKNVHITLVKVWRCNRSKKQACMAHYPDETGAEKKAGIWVGSGPPLISFLGFTIRRVWTHQAVRPVRMKCEEHSLLFPSSVATTLDFWLDMSAASHNGGGTLHFPKPIGFNCVNTEMV